MSLTTDELAQQLAKESCVPCRSGGPSLTRQAAMDLLPAAPGFALDDDARALQRRFTFPSFKRAIAFVNRMADLAESEGHHPDFSVHYQKIDVVLTTHDVGGLSRNDFIVAAKLDTLYKVLEGPVQNDEAPKPE
ncbi:MAG TPA: 4a-hydroxytetrahydrobiopterin dehydratase [Polyangia bacterium]